MNLGHVKCEQEHKALELFPQMQQEVVPMLLHLKRVGVVMSRSFKVDVISMSLWGCKSDVFVVNSLVDMYAKCGSMEDAHWVFNMMPAQNMVSLNAVLGGCAMHGQSNEALKHFEQMCEHVQSNDITSVCLLSAFSHAGLVNASLHCYACMSVVYMFSTTLDQYACMVNLLGHDGCLQEAENMI
jgi:pentatricopeptide repeat protein